MKLIYFVIFGFFCFSLSKSACSVEINEQLKISGVVEKKRNFFDDISQDNLLNIARFLRVPQRYFGSLNKYFAHVFKEVLPFSRIVSEHFNIPNLKLSKFDNDLIWFANYYECYTHNPEYLLKRLFFEIFNEKSFSTNLSYLIQYLIDMFENDFTKDSNLSRNSLYLLIKKKFELQILDENYIKLISIYLKYPKIYKSFLANKIHQFIYYIDIENNIGLEFFIKNFQWLDADIEKNENSELFSKIFNFEEFNNEEFDIFELLKLIKSKSHEHKSVAIYQALLNSILLQNRPKVHEKKDSSSYLSFIESFAKNRLGFLFSIKNNCKIFQRNMKLIDRARSEDLVRIDLASNLHILNEIYFGDEINFSKSFVETHCANNFSNLLTSAIKFKNLKLFSILLDLPQFLNNIQFKTSHNIFKDNLPFFFKITEKYPNWNSEFYVHSVFIFKEISKYYAFVDFIKNNSSSCTLVMELKPEYRDGNPAALDYPTIYNYNYNYNYQNNYDQNFNANSLIFCFNFENVLENFTGSNENSFRELLKLTIEKSNLITTKSYEIDHMTDAAIKLILSSENLKNYLSNLDYCIFFDSKQLLRLYRNLNNPVEAFQSLKFKIRLKNFKDFKSDFDFGCLEKLTGKKGINLIQDFIGKILLNRPEYLMDEFINIQNALYYLVRSGNNLNIRGIYPTIIELFKLDSSEEKNLNYK